MSHVLLRHVEWSGFSQNSVGEYLMPGSLAGILYANRYAETKIVGLTTLFEHQLGFGWRTQLKAEGNAFMIHFVLTKEAPASVACTVNTIVRNSIASSREPFSTAGRRRRPNWGARSA